MMGVAGLAGLGALGGLASYSMTPDYTGYASQYGDAMSDISSDLDPYVSQGFAAKKGLGAMGAMNMIAPAALENRLAASYQMSPYQQQIMQNTTNMMDANAAQTGMLGSTSQDAALQNQLASQQNQWMQQYINRGTQRSELGEQGLQNLGTMMAKQGYGASNTQAQLEAQIAMAQMQAQIAQAQAEQQGTSNIFGDALGVATLGLL